MIKSLFDEDDEKAQGEIKTKNQTETREINEFSPDENGLLEIHFANDAKTGNFLETPAIDDSESVKTAAILQDADNIAPDAAAEPVVNFTLSNPFEPATSSETPKKKTDEPMLFQMQSKPESTAETARKSGLAMSAAVTLFGSVVFLLIIGWFADLLLGTSPWGIVAGIVLGSIIGFFQFFRMTSQILKNED